MINVFWNPKQIALVGASPKGEKFYILYYINNILEKLQKLDSGFPDTNGKKLNIHTDNVRPHIYIYISKAAIGYIKIME